MIGTSSGLAPFVHLASVARRVIFARSGAYRPASMAVSPCVVVAVLAEWSFARA